MSHPNPKMMLDQNTLFYAFRYALGRSTAAVDDMAGRIKTRIDEITSNNLRQMAHEIEIERDRGTLGVRPGGLGDNSSRQTWLELLVTIYEELGNRRRSNG